MGGLIKFYTGRLRPEVQPLALLYRELGETTLQRHLGVNGVYTTWNVGRLILIYEKGTNPTHQTSRAVPAVHKTSVLGIGKRISHSPLSPSLLPPTHAHTHTHTHTHTHIWILPRKKNGLTMTETSNSVDILKVGLEKNDRPADCSPR